MSTFPDPVRLNGRLYWHREAIENHKRSLLGLPPLPADSGAKIELVSASDVAAEFGFGRRTLGRRLAKRDDNAAGEAA